MNRHNNDFENIIMESVRLQAGFADNHHVSPDDRLVDDLGLDSLDIAELILSLERRFDIHIDDSFTPVTVWDLMEYVSSVLNENTQDDNQDDLVFGE